MLSPCSDKKWGKGTRAWELTRLTGVDKQETPGALKDFRGTMASLASFPDPKPENEVMPISMA